MLKKFFRRMDSSVKKQTNLPLLKKAVAGKVGVDVFLGDMSAYNAYVKVGKEPPLRSSSLLDINDEEFYLVCEYIYPRTPVYKGFEVVVQFQYDRKLYLFESKVMRIDRTEDILHIEIPDDIHNNEKRTAFRANVSRFNISVQFRNISQTESAQSSGQITTFEYRGKAYDMSERGMLFMSFTSMTVDINDVVLLEFSVPALAAARGIDVKCLARVAHIRSLNRFCGLDLYTSDSPTEEIPFHDQYPHVLSAEMRFELGRFVRAANIENLKSERVMALAETQQARTLDARMEDDEDEEDSRRNAVVLGDIKNRFYNNDRFRSRFKILHLADETRIIDMLRRDEDALILYDNTADKDDAGISLSWGDLIKNLRSAHIRNQVIVLDSIDLDKAKVAKLRAYRVLYLNTTLLSDPREVLDALDELP